MFEVFVAKEGKACKVCTGAQIQHSLFESGFNRLEKDFAL